MYVRKLPSGKWSCVVRHPSGRRVSKSDPLKRVVMEWGRAKESEFRTGRVSVERLARITVGQWFDRWMDARSVEGTTARKDASRLRNHVLPYWSPWPLASIGRLDVQTWVKGMDRAGVGAPTVHGSYQLLASILNDAVLEGILTASPCQRIDLPKVQKPPPRWLTRHEVDRILLALGAMPHGEVWQAYVDLACWSGLRPGELAGLDISALDFDRSLVRAEQVMTRVGLRAYPKSSSSVRSVPFPPEVADRLWRLVADRPAGPVFLSPEGCRVGENNFRARVWHPALKAAGIEPVRPYVTRHTCASWLVQEGVPSEEIAQILGHASTQLVRTYAHLRPDQHDRVRAAWSRLTSDPQAVEVLPALPHNRRSEASAEPSSDE